MNAIAWVLVIWAGVNVTAVCVAVAYAVAKDKS